RTALTTDISWCFWIENSFGATCRPIITTAPVVFLSRTGTRRSGDGGTRTRWRRKFPRTQRGLMTFLGHKSGLPRRSIRTHRFPREFLSAMPAQSQINRVLLPVWLPTCARSRRLGDGSVAFTLIERSEERRVGKGCS